MKNMILEDIKDEIINCNDISDVEKTTLKLLITEFEKHYIQVIKFGWYSILNFLLSLLFAILAYMVLNNNSLLLGIIVAAVAVKLFKMANDYRIKGNDILRYAEIIFNELDQLMRKIKDERRTEQYKPAESDTE